MKEIRALASIEGILRVMKVSFRSLRQPDTTSKPSCSLSISRGMSAGSFCRSPSIGMMISPDAASKPADMAAVWPKLRRKRMTLTRRSCCGNVFECVEGAIGRAIIDHDDLIVGVAAVQGRGNRPVQFRDVVFFVVNRDHNAKVHAALPIDSSVVSVPCIQKPPQ